MNRQEILEQLLVLAGQAREAGSPDLKGHFAAMPAKTRQELVGLWAGALERNPWLIPTKVLELGYEDFCDWLLASADHFALGYMLASLEQLDALGRLDGEPYSWN